ncbi:lipopolysaccharide biosynthesis protein [Dysgonomonas sp. 520]|uniref:lipopolysaccharide biosynthesis protein n=1 Tax=Dysgonomonas sp. 520 TaxID=2302931 RepID=UPI0013CF56C2|nr:lipopolysaccharide biosynthesis protein [Dysgonomonas sp. 520]NDW10854.1 lipopolysaccharide biosynthesis protein [Dysgonomonas sp. 520]
MSDSLKDKTISGLKWSGLEKSFQQLFVFFAGIFLARILHLSDYGLIAILSIFAYGANALTESGFSAALIRKKDVTEDDYNTVFWFNIASASVLYVILFFLAPVIGNFYDEPKLVPLSRVIFLMFLFNAFGMVQSTQVIKAMNYKLNTQINVISIIVSYTIALILAYRGHGIWALAAQLVIHPACKTIFLWLGNKWRPKFIFSTTAFKDLFRFGGNLLAHSLIYTFTSRSTSSFIGKYLGIASAGVFETANRLYNSGLDMFMGTILNVSFPMMSKIESDAELKRIFRKITRVSSFLIFPFFMGLMLTARPFIIYALGDKWAASVQALQILSLCGIFFTLNTLNTNLLKTAGKSLYILITEIVYASLIVIIFILAVSLKWGLYEVIMGIALTNFISLTINFFRVREIIGYKLTEYLKDILPYLCIAAFSIALGFSLTYFITNLLLLLILEIIVTAGVYIGVTYILGSKIIKELFSMLKLKKI